MPVYGIAVVSQHVYIVRPWSTVIEVYDTNTYHPLPHLSIPRLLDVTDIAGCALHQQLYVADSDSRALHTIALTNDDHQLQQQQHLVGHWSLKNKPYGVSVSTSGHVIVSFSNVSLVTIYIHTGEEQREIVVSDVVNLRHAILLDSGQLVICHGCHQHQAGAGVAIIDSDGRMVTRETNTQLGWATDVATDQRGGFIYVADYSNKRVVQLQSDLTYISDILGYDQRLRNPRSICVDSAARRLYVADASGSVLVFALT